MLWYIKTTNIIYKLVDTGASSTNTFTSTLAPGTSTILYASAICTNNYGRN